MRGNGQNLGAYMDESEEVGKIKKKKSTTITGKIIEKKYLVKEKFQWHIGYSRTSTKKSIK